jgi:hypothetical protein
MMIAVLAMTAGCESTSAWLRDLTATDEEQTILGAPGANTYLNGIEAQSLLRSLLSQTELMTPAEIALATIHLQEVEERLVLDAEARRLRAESTRATTTEEAAVARRIANVEAENRRLRQRLADTEAKLEALSAIERSLRDQNSNDDPPR